MARLGQFTSRSLHGVGGLAIKYTDSTLTNFTFTGRLVATGLVYGGSTAIVGTNYYAVGSSNTWTSATTNISVSGNWGCPASDGNTVVQIDMASSSTYTTTDGVTWTQKGNRQIITSGQYWTNVATNGTGTWVTVSGVGVAGTQVAISNNSGTSWTTSTTGLAPLGGWDHIEYGGGAFVAISAGYGGASARSTNGGITWTTTSTSNRLGLGPTAEEKANAQFFYASGTINKWWMFREASNAITSSNSLDGLTWSTATNSTAIGVSGAGYLLTQYGNGIFVSVNQNSQSTWTSTDGINWTRNQYVFSDPNSTYFWTFVFTNGTFVLTSLGGYSTYTYAIWNSTDGVNWYKVTASPKLQDNSSATGRHSIVGLKL